MRIGVDFDNTIVSYDLLFYKVASEAGLIPPDIARTKLGVRDYLRKIGKEDLWTEMQGYVYGARMNEAIVFPGVPGFLSWARDQGVIVPIISHKAQYPFLGPKYDLHEAARRWVETYLVDEHGDLVARDQVLFELTKEEKLKRIIAVGCDYFIDDLPEILMAREFPSGTGRILFDPEGHHPLDGEITVMSSWRDILRHFEAKWVLKH